jgi:hypothetical protein
MNQHPENNERKLIHYGLSLLIAGAAMFAASTAIPDALASYSEATEIPKKGMGEAQHSERESYPPRTAAVLRSLNC